MADEDYVYDEASGEWMPASQLAERDRQSAEAADTVEVRDAVGNILEDDFWKVWNGPRYSYSRELIKRQRVGTNPVDTMCHDCTGIFPDAGTRRYWKIRSGGGAAIEPENPAKPEGPAGATG